MEMPQTTSVTPLGAVLAAAAACAPQLTNPLEKMFVEQLLPTLAGQLAANPEAPIQARLPDMRDLYRYFPGFELPWDDESKRAALRLIREQLNCVIQGSGFRVKPSFVLDSVRIHLKRAETGGGQ